MVKKPGRRTGRRLGRRRGLRRGLRRGRGFKKNMPTLLVNPILNKRLMPDRYRCVARATFCCILTAANIGDGLFKWMVVEMNTPLIPYSIGIIPGAPTGQITFAATGATSGFAFGTAQQTGLSHLIKADKTGIYENYRVVASKLQVTLLPTTSNDNLFICIAPVDNFVVSPTSLYTSLNKMSEGNCATKIQFTSPLQVNQNRIKSYLPIAKAGGVPRQTVLTVPQYAGQSAAVPDARFGWQIGLQTCDGLTLGGAGVPMKVDVSHYTEFYNPTETELDF